MSVLVEALTLVVQRVSLDREYPHGADGFLRDVATIGDPPCFACADDDQLLNLSCRDRRHAQPLVERLLAHGLGEESDADVGDFVLVDQLRGPLVSCPWLEWTRADGVTYAWIAGEAPGELAAPSGWNPGAADADAQGRLFRLSSDDRVETYLDLDTAGQIEVPIAPDLLSDVPPAIPAVTPLFDALLEAFRDTGWSYYSADAPGVSVNLSGDEAAYCCRYVAYEESELLVCCVRSPMNVPKRARRRAMEYISRANFGLMYGAFEMDLDDGRLFFRTAIDVEGVMPTTAMVRNMAGCGVGQLDRFLPGLMDVVYARRAPAQAIADARR